MKQPFAHAGRLQVRAFSLMEAVVSIGIVGVMLAASLSTVGAAYMHRQVMEDHARASLLAQELMAEILVEPYQDPSGTGNAGLETGESAAPRSNFDDVDDYDGWSASPPVTQTGTAIPNLDGWTRSVSVIHSLESNLKSTATVESGIKRITVTVQKDGVTLATLVAIRTAGADNLDAKRGQVAIEVGGQL